MALASFRFYAQLNDFLPPHRRGRRFTCETSEASTLKDTIESLGVPHPEIDLIVVNGAPASFDRAVVDGDQIAVYPRFWSIDVGDLPRVSAPVPVPARFVADVHLAQLTARLRLAGFDVKAVAADEDVARLSEREERIALTRDRELLKRKIVRGGCWIRSSDPDDQFVEVLRRFDLVLQVRPFTRCLQCNALLRPVAKERVLERLPPGVVPLFEDFHECPSCGRVYWHGSHYDRLRERLARAVDRARTG